MFRRLPAAHDGGAPGPAFRPATPAAPPDRQHVACRQCGFRPSSCAPGTAAAAATACSRRRSGAVGPHPRGHVGGPSLQQPALRGQLASASERRGAGRRAAAQGPRQPADVPRHGRLPAGRRPGESRSRQHGGGTRGPGSAARPSHRRIRLEGAAVGQAEGTHLEMDPAAGAAPLSAGAAVRPAQVRLRRAGGQLASRAPAGMGRRLAQRLARARCRGARPASGAERRGTITSAAGATAAASCGPR